MRTRIPVTVGVLVAILALGWAHVRGQEDSGGFAYEQTRQLVDLVSDSAALVQQLGTNAFAEFSRPGSRWQKSDSYLFAYQPDGVCAYHALSPDLVGQNLLQLRDMNGKYMIREITTVGDHPEPDASGWVFYLWQEGPGFIPSWKSSFVRKVTAPDGQVYVVGSGLYNMRVEKAFVRDRVQQAARLLREQGLAAFNAFRDPAAPFSFLDTYIFVITTDGHSVVDPSFPTHAGRSLLDFRDAVGHYVTRELLDKIQHTDEAWVEYMSPRPGSAVPARKLMYAVKVALPQGDYLVGSDFFMPTPIWMKN